MKFPLILRLSSVMGVRVKIMYYWPLSSLTIELKDEKCTFRELKGEGWGDISPFNPLALSKCWKLLLQMLETIRWWLGA